MVGLGSYPIVTLAEARAKCVENRRAIEQGRARPRSAVARDTDRRRSVREGDRDPRAALAQPAHRQSLAILGAQPCRRHHRPARRPGEHRRHPGRAQPGMDNKARTGPQAVPAAVDGVQVGSRREPHRHQPRRRCPRGRAAPPRRQRRPLRLAARERTIDASAAFWSTKAAIRMLALTATRVRFLSRAHNKVPVRTARADPTHNRRRSDARRPRPKPGPRAGVAHPGGVGTIVPPAKDIVENMGCD